MIRKFSEFDRMKNYHALMENSEIIHEDLKEDFSYEEILCTVIPMSFSNPFEDFECELIALLTSEGMRMGFLLEDVACIIMMDPNFKSHELDLSIAFVDKGVLHSTGVKFELHWTNELKKDCLLWENLMLKEKVFFVNLIALLGMDPNSPIQ